MSPRAALRLETLGFREVYDYVPGKVDWLAHGLPREGVSAGHPTAGDFVRKDVVGCRLDDSVKDVARNIQDSVDGFALVLGDNDVVLGRIRRSAIEGHEFAGTAQAVMEPGPSTVRPNLAAEDARQQMRDHDLNTLVVTTPEGRLIGVLRREDVEAAKQA